MLMERQGKKKTRDFLSLYTRGSSFQLLDSNPLSQAHDFLQPVERAEKEKERKGPAERTTHVLPGGIGTYSIGHLSSGDRTYAAVKAESSTCGADDTYAFPVWDAGRQGGAATGQWQKPFDALSTPSNFGSLASARSDQFPDKKQQFMEPSSRLNKGFEDDDEDDEDFGRRDCPSHIELTGKNDGKTGEQKATTPRSKHSATEQRRRSKINDRFQILRGILPNSDQKRDKASFLLEVIEYIQFLQEKLQKYEAVYPGWSEETVKLLPWISHHGSGEGIIDSQLLKNGSSSGLLVSDNSIPAAPSILSPAQNPTETELIAGISYKALESANSFSNKIAASSPILQSNLYPLGRGTCIAGQSQQRLIPEAVNTASQSEWLRSSFPVGCSVSSDALNEHELAIDEGTISISSEYSQGLLNTLSQALQNSGIDLSQACISVHINLGRRASAIRHNVSSSMATSKDLDEPISGILAMNSSTRIRNRNDESEQATKRHKSDHS